MSNKSYLSIYAKSFSWAGFFLPKKTLEKCSALYDFCRVADNIADDNEKIENKEKKFNYFENNFNQKNFDDPIIKNMWDLIEEFNISLKIVQDLFIGVKSDIKDKVKLNSKKDLACFSNKFVIKTIYLIFWQKIELLAFLHLDVFQHRRSINFQIPQIGYEI